jgi:hypothetical protein
MKKILSEKNIAGVLFILVLVIFSFAHEYSKKRNERYNVSVPSISSENTSASIITIKKNTVSSAKQLNFSGKE